MLLKQSLPLYLHKSYFITHRPYSVHGLICDVTAAIEGGCKVIQYREKERHKYESQIKHELKEIRKITAQAGVLLIVNDYVDLASEFNADGVHIGQSDTDYRTARRILGPEKIIGVSVNYPHEACEAQKLGADYLGVGCVFSPHSKTDGVVIELLGLENVLKENIHIPIVAIGGINHDNIQRLLQKGVRCCAMIGTIYYGQSRTNPYITQNIRQLNQYFQ